ncbi:hypothetical protein D3C85_1052700 [compost metagenome]
MLPPTLASTKPLEPGPVCRIIVSTLSANESTLFLFAVNVANIFQAKPFLLPWMIFAFPLISKPLFCTSPEFKTALE